MRAIERVIRRAGWSLDVLATGGPGDARRLAAEAVADGMDVVAVLGGDGTTMQAAAALVGSNTALGLLPGGTGNLLAGNLRLSPNPIKAANAMVRGIRQPLDLGRIMRPDGEHYFAVAAGTGADARVMVETQAMHKHRWGMMAYVATMLRLLPEVRNIPFEITIDGVAHEARAAMVMVANCGEVIPRLIRIGSGVRHDDGLLDVLVLSADSVGGSIRAMWDLLVDRSGSYGNDSFVAHARGREISVRTLDGSQHPVQLDGDPGGLGVGAPPQGPRHIHDPDVQRVGDHRIIVELPGETDIDRARQLINQTAFLEFRHVRDLTPLVNVLPRMDRAVIAELGPEGLADAAPGEPAGQMQQDVRDRIFGEQRTDTAGDTLAADSAAADTAATADTPPTTRPLSDLLLGGSAGEVQVAEENVERVKRYLALPGVAALIPRGTALVWAADQAAVGAQLYRSLYLLEDKAFINGERLQNATASRDPQFGETIVQFEFDRRGGRTFGEQTQRNIGNRIAIVLDNEVHSAPVVQSQINASGQIQMGQAPMEEARDLALVLRAGAFSAPLVEVENRQIGPSLGQDSIDQGKIAGIIGVVLVLLIMMWYYRMAGVLAVAALAVYVMILLGSLSAIGAALSAPGIAGMILSLGMAVDANVLIFERIREELALGRTVRAAVDNGFQHAMSAIVDSNITTLLTGLILFQVGTGPVRGFAVTLSLGIIASFFSAVFVTRTFFLLYLERRRTADAISI